MKKKGTRNIEEGKVKERKAEIVAQESRCFFRGIYSDKNSGLFWFNK